MKILKPDEKLKDRIVSFRTDQEVIEKITDFAQKRGHTKSAFIEQIVKKTLEEEAI